MSYEWPWVGKFGKAFQKKFDVVRRSDAERALQLAVQHKNQNVCETRLLRVLQGMGARYIVFYEDPEHPRVPSEATPYSSGTILTIATLKVNGKYFIGSARESRSHEFNKRRARLVALGRAWKAATRGWTDGDGHTRFEQHDKLGRRIAGPVELVDLPDHLRLKEDRGCPEESLD